MATTRKPAARNKKMLELTGTGDDGTTGLLGGGRAPKDDPRIEALGTVDEASGALGLARSLTRQRRVKVVCEELQRGLYKVGAEIGTSPRSRTAFATTTAADVVRLEQLIAELEAEVTMPDGFILPGATQASAALDMARAISRRAERRCVSISRGKSARNAYLGRWLNRLSLLLFVLGRYEESLEGRRAPAARTRPGRSG